MTTKPKRPRRKQKGDRLLNPDANKRQIEIDFAIAPFDKLATEMERKWGIDRLPDLVPPGLARRYGQAVAYLNECIASEAPNHVVEAVNNCIRGLHALDAEATKQGKAPMNLWEYDLDGFKFAIIEDDRRWPELEDSRPDLTPFTMREVALALKMFHDTAGGIIGEAKKLFPNAEAVAVRPKSKNFERNPEDAIPF